MLYLTSKAAEVVGDGFPDEPGDLRGPTLNKVIDKSKLYQVADHYFMHVHCYHPGYAGSFPKDSRPYLITHSSSEV